MKKIFQLIGIYFIAVPLVACADFIDILPQKREITGNLPAGDIQTHFLPRVIDIMMKGAYTISVGFMVYAGILYFYAHGDTGDMDKAKNIMIYSVIGFLIISVSYAVIEGVTRFTWHF